jgi:hypothetical protein
MFPGKDETKPPTQETHSTDQFARRDTAPTSPAPISAPKLSVETHTPPGSGDPYLPIPPLPTTPVSPAPPSAPAIPVAPPATLKPRDITPVGGLIPPAVVPDKPVPPPSLDPFIPTVPSIYPVGAEAPKPPPTGGSPPIPPVPAPVFPPVTPPAPPSGGPIIPAPDFPPVPTPKPPDPAFPPIPVPGGTSNPPVPVAPPIPPVPPPGGVAVPPAPPSVLPFDMNPKPDPTLKPIPRPALDPPIGVPTTFGKPAGGNDVKPLVPEAHPNTGFDVDLYDPKLGDTYESISLDYYNDKRFATALKAFNVNKPLQGGHYVEVPPIHILKKKFPAQVGVVPIGGTSPAPTSPPSTAPEWGAPTRPEVPARTAGNNRGTFIVPAGWTMVTLARQYGVKWDDIYALNPTVHPSDPIPAGTELRMPANAKLP